ncbi:MAG: hypothetical protein HY079_06870, partial [Elusimicrobia bacterium]|nr:hypothetical protein [Elusimicrobiota bacterium]
MRRALLSLLLAAAGTAHAALPRVLVDAPLAPASAPAYVAAPGALGAAGAYSPSALAAAPSAVSLSAAPLAAAPLAAPAALPP